MILQEEQLLVTVGTLVFNSHHISTPEYRFDETAIEGWFDGVQMRRTEEVRPTQWGDFRTLGYLGARLITLTGTAIANSRVELQAMRDEFTNILSNGGYTEMSVYTLSTGRRYAEVGLESRPQWIPRTDTFATFKLDLLAPDPRQYGMKRTWTVMGRNYTGGMKFPITYPLYYGNKEPFETQILTNFGNVETWPKIKVTGNMPDGFIISNGSGKRVIYDGPVSTAAPVELDFAEGTAKQRGLVRTSNLSRRDWFGIEPGSSIQPSLQYINQGQGWMEIEIRDAWV